uniref:Uncharacterized protein n=1 Tax=Anguilla anguilla TaxID=7936 RepID=A0A0E9PY12_ANGAN
MFTMYKKHFMSSCLFLYPV